MLCAIIKGPTYQEAQKQISLMLKRVDCFEIRLDLFHHLDMSALKQLCQHCALPLILTLRSHQQGGQYRDVEEKYYSDLRRLADLKPSYLDLEMHLPLFLIDDIRQQHPEIKLILSYHNFEKTPHHFDDLYQTMCQIPAHFYKIAVTAQNSLDTLRLLNWFKTAERNVIVISMGFYGQMSRILGPVMGNPITYASLDEDQQTAPGQLPVALLLNRYHYRFLHEQTPIYGLIGDPVNLSISDETHNTWFQTFEPKCLYIKIQVAPAEGEEFLRLAKQLPFTGLSVTMPLKECLLPYLDEIDSEALLIGAINTLLLQEGKMIGYNTDGRGALNAIEQICKIAGKKVIVIGAGGAAKAIAYEAKRRSAHVTIINRDVNKAQKIAKRFQCFPKRHIQECVEEGYDILINCTPLEMPISPEDILPQSLVMDIKTRPLETLLLKEALQKGCSIIYGYQMFIEQAIEQLKLWFKNQIDEDKCRHILKKKAEECLSVKDR